MTAPTLKQQVSSGVFWSGSARVLQQAVQFGVSIILARLLSPGEYGLMAMAMVFTGFAGMLADAGFNAAVIQRKELSDAHIHTVFWITLMAGGALAAVTFVLSPLIAHFFKAPALKLLLRLIALNFLFGGIGNVPSALLQRRMKFRTIAKIETSALVISGILGVGMAFFGAGVWSLVGQSLSSSLLTSGFRCWSCRWIPKLRFCRSALKEIWSFSSHLYGFNLINFWARNADNLLVGKFFGAAALGAYSRAYALMLLPITQINGMIYQVVFAAFSSIQGDKERVKRIYLQITASVTLVAFPIMTGLLVVAEPFVLTVYGEKWRAAVVLLQILAPVGGMQVLTNLAGMLFATQGRTDLLLRWGLCLTTVTIVAFGIGALLGSVRWVAFCYAVANASFFFPGLAVAARVVDMKLLELLTAAAGPFLCSVFMAVTVAWVGTALPVGWPAWQNLSVLMLAGVVSYAIVICVFQLSVWKELVGFIRPFIATSPVSGLLSKRWF